MPCEGRTLDATLAEAAELSEDSRRSATEGFAVTAFPTGEVTKTPSATDRFAVASLTGEDGRKGNADNTGGCKIGEDEVEVEEAEERPRARGVSEG